jgi:hypothetical protein
MSAASDTSRAAILTPVGRALAMTAVLSACTTTNGGGPPGVAGTVCAYPTDVSKATTFQGDTCDGGVEVPLAPCASQSAAAIFAVGSQGAASHRTFHVTDGFAVLAAPPNASCSFLTTECDAGGAREAIAVAGETSYLAVARADGTCGPFRLDVYNASSCADTSDAGSCRCGDIAACPAGQGCHVGPSPQFAGSCGP